MKNRQRLLGAVVAGIAAVAMFPAAASGQAAPKESANVQELRAIKTAIGKDSAGLPAAASVKGMELTAVKGIGDDAMAAMMEVDNAIWFVSLYEQMQSEPDRAAYKAALINRIHLFRPLLDAQVYQIDESLALASLPATIQAGHKLQADLRAASAKLTKIEAGVK